MAKLDLLHLPNEGADLTTLAHWTDVEHIVAIRALTNEAENAFCAGRDAAYLDVLGRLEAEVNDAIASFDHSQKVNQ